MEQGNGKTFVNWAEAYKCTPKKFFIPKCKEEVAQVLEMARKDKCGVRVLGRGHSPSDIPFTDDYLILITSLNKVLHIDRENQSIKVEAGALIRDLNKILESEGMAISVLGSVDDITIGGAASTGTHGTGVNFTGLSGYIKEFELMKSNGEVVVASRESDQDLYRAVGLSFGSLGVIISVTLQCEPLFYLHESQSPSTLDQVLDNLDRYLQSCDHFRFTWFPYSEVVLYKTSRQPEMKEMADVKASWFWDYGVGFHFLQFLYWIGNFFEGLVPYINRFFYAIQYSVPREMSQIGYKQFQFECLFKQFVEEWSIPREKTAVVMRQLREFIEGERIPAHFPLEVRFARADDFLLSPASGRDVCYINIISYRAFGQSQQHGNYFKQFGEIMKRHGGRPHWAKDHGQTATEFSQMYPEWEKFCKIRRQMDPTGMFINKNLKLIFGDYL